MSTLKDSIWQQFNEAAEVLNTFSTDENIEKIALATTIMVAALKAGNKIISCGNGGSMSDAMHFAEELSGRFREDRPGLAAISISDPSHLSCVANDYGYAKVFSRFVQALGNSGDVLLAISTSGNSENVINAIHEAKQKGMTIVALTGKTGGTIATLADLEIRVAHNGYADRIQEVHIKIIHTLIYGIELGMK
ncbi:MAG: D-sedoheptulose 7-phosphate isomerase [Bacteroidota bacterium]|jgi:D-sedoheptulose 7-phosphate isomerase